MNNSRFDQYVTTFEYFSLDGDSMTQIDCDSISGELKNWLEGQLPCTAQLLGGKVEVTIGHFSHDSGFDLGTDLFAYLAHTALRRLNKSVAYNIVGTRENV